MKPFINLLVVLALSAALGLDAQAKSPKPRKSKKPGKLFVPGAGKARHNPSEIFKKLDSDADQSLSPEEFIAGHIGKKDPHKAGQIFTKKDADSDGKLSAEEFTALKKNDKKTTK